MHKLLPFTDDVQEVSIVPRGMAGGYTMSRPETDDNYATLGKLNSMICTLMGGRVAEEIIFKDITTGASNDIEKATKLARRMVTQFGMSQRLGFINLGSTSEVFIGRDYQNQVEYSEKTAGIIDEEVQKILNDNYQKAKELLTTNKDKLDAMADLLLKCETIYTDEVNMIMEGKPNEEIIEVLKQKEEAEQKELERERELKAEQDKQKVEELKKRAFDAMRQSGLLTEEEIAKAEQESNKKSEDEQCDKNAQNEANKFAENETKQNQDASKDDVNGSEADNDNGTDKE